MTKRIRPRPWRGDGQALVEFALVFPILMLLIFGIFDMGRAVFAYNAVANAARDGARVAMVNQIETSTDCNQSKPIENPATPHWSIKACAANSATSLGIQQSDVTVSYYAPPGTTLVCPATPSALTPINVGCIASVTVVYQFQPLTPVIGNIVGTIGMSSTSQIPVERVFP